MLVSELVFFFFVLILQINEQPNPSESICRSGHRFRETVETNQGSLGSCKRFQIVSKSPKRLAERRNLAPAGSLRISNRRFSIVLKRNTKYYKTNVIAVLFYQIFRPFSHALLYYHYTDFACVMFFFSSVVIGVNVTKTTYTTSIKTNAAGKHNATHYVFRQWFFF